MSNILIVGEERHSDILNALKKSDVRITESSSDNCLNMLSLEAPDCVILCSNSQSSVTPHELISGIKQFDDCLPVVVVGAESLEDAVNLMKAGASDCLRFPVNTERLQLAVASAVRMCQLTKKLYLLENQAGLHNSFESIIGVSAKMQEIFQLIATVSKSTATVLILGESGTGKELVARAVHNKSPRSKQPFIDINCGAIPRELLENELFGHERGSYTGADRRYIGCCERANGGTLFLDEICEMEPALQVKILRLLQERTFQRVGGNELIKSDIRFIAATNKNISEEVSTGNFREDLYYRLNVVPITLPPLRERPEDVPFLAKHFLEKLATKNEKMFVNIDNTALECLMGYSWPGNVRELENVMERVVVLNNDSTVKAKHLPPNLQKAKKTLALPVNMNSGQKIIPLDLVEKYAIEAALAKCLGNVNEAASQLKIGQATLYRKIKQYGLKT